MICIPRIACLYSKLLPITAFLPHPQHRQRHSAAEIDQLAAALNRHGWRRPLIVSTSSGYLIAGHGLHLAAQAAGITHAPVEYQAFDCLQDELEFMAADNLQSR